jgi:RimJ/RimL family protein N-acetyltransferase
MRLPIQSARLVLREMAAADWQAIHAYNRAPEFHRFLPFAPPTRETTRGFVALCVARAREDPRRHFDIVLQERGFREVVGTLRLSLRGRGSGDVGYAIRPESWNRGFATEAVAALLAAARVPLGLGEIWATVDPDNAASRRVMEKLGFRRLAGEAGAPIKPGRPPSLVYLRHEHASAESISERAV